MAVTLYEAISLYNGKRVIASRGHEGTNWKVHQLFMYSSLGVVAGIVGGLLGLGGGFILGPLFLELGIPPQVFSLSLLTYIDCQISMYVNFSVLLNLSRVTILHILLIWPIIVYLILLV